MFFRLLCVFVFALYCSVAYSAECDFDAKEAFLSRVVAINSANGLIYPVPKKEEGGLSGNSFELNSNEIILTFDQGPHPVYTRYILDILDHHCAKATFFFSGAAALADPAAVRETARRGHTLAAGPWSSSANFATMPIERAQAQIEKGFAAIAKASGAPVAPFFRVASPIMPSAAFDYLKERGISLWYADIDAGPGLTATQLANQTLLRIRKAGKGVVRFHGTSKVTVDALDSILTGLKHDGFRVVHIVPTAPYTPNGEFMTQLALLPDSAPSSNRISRRLENAAKGPLLPSERDRRERQTAEQRRANSAKRRIPATGTAEQE